jgi:hypothetical protein
MNLSRGLAAVLFAMQQKAVAQFMAVAPAGLHGGQYAMPFIGIYRGFQAGGNVILCIYGQNEGQNDAISFLTGHVFHPDSRLRRRCPNPHTRRRARHKKVAIPVLRRKTATRNAESPIDPLSSKVSLR